MSLQVGGKRSSSVGAAWTMTAGADMVLSSGDALEIAVGAALATTGATSIAFKVGSSKVLVGQGGVVIEASTARNHLQNLYAKLGVTQRGELLALVSKP